MAAKRIGRYNGQLAAEWIGDEVRLTDAALMEQLAHSLTELPLEGHAGKGIRPLTLRGGARGW